MSFSFKTWPFPSPKNNRHLLKCSKYGLIAHAMNNNVSIYFEEFGHFTPLTMWSPFQHQITAIEWYDASKTMNTAVPVLVISSISGRIEVYDCRSRIGIFKTHINLNQSSNSISNLTFPNPTTLTHIQANSRRENDYVTSIAWSQFSSSTFFVGTKNGRLVRFEITIGQIVKCRIVWELFFDFQIDHICIEPQFGEICAVASKKGSIATIQNINKFHNGKPPEASPNVVTLSNKTDSIIQIDFYPTSTDFLILVTTSNSLLYSINDCCTAPLLMLPGIRKFHILHESGNMSLIVREDTVEIWSSLATKSKRLAELKMVTTPKYTNQKEVIVSDMMGDKLILLTSQMWLTTVEVKNSTKLFVTHRVKLLDSKPLSFSYANESIAIATANGNVLISETSNSNFIAQMAIGKQSLPGSPEKGTANIPAKTEAADIKEPNSPDTKKVHLERAKGDDKAEPSCPNSSTNNSSNLNNANNENNLNNANNENNLNNANNEDNLNNVNNANSVPPSPLSGSFDNTDPAIDNTNITDSFDNAKNVPLADLKLRPNISISKSQDITLSLDSDMLNVNKPQTRRSRIRKNIIKSCASSSSLFLDAIGGSSPREEEILDKSIVYDSHEKANLSNPPSPLLANNASLPVPSLSNVSIPQNIQKISGSSSRQRRNSTTPSESLSSGSILSRVVNEGIKTMPKDSSSVVPIPIPRPKTNKPLPPSLLVKSKTASSALPLSESSSKCISQSESISEIDNKSSQLIPPMFPIADESADEEQPKNLKLGKSSSSKTLFNSSSLLKDDGKKSAFPQVSRVIPKNKFGNNCTIMWNYQIEKNTIIEHIEWIASTRVIAYSLAKPDEDREKPNRRHSSSRLSDSADSLDSSVSTNASKLYSGTSFIYLIDLKYHRISRLFEKPGINITAVAFSANKQYFFVIINGFMAVLFKNKLKPQQVFSFTFKRPIYVTFVPHYLTIIDLNGEVTFIEMKEKEEDMKPTKKQLKMKKEYGTITCIYAKKNLIYLGTTTGYILSFDVSTMKFSEFLQMKAPIYAFKSGLSGTFLVEDSKGKMITVASDDGDITRLPANLKVVILTSPTILLIRRKKHYSIEVYQTIGQYSPTYPKAAYRCPLMMPANRWIQALVREDPIDQSVLINYGMPNIASLLDARKSPNFTFEQTTYLRDLIMNTPQLWKTSYRLSIFLRDFETAHSIIAKYSNSTGTNDKWAINVIKSALFNNDLKSNEKQVENILFAASTLIKNGFVDDGVDILLTEGLWIDAVKLLVQIGKIQTAAVITRVYRDKNSLNVVKEIAAKMFQMPNSLAYALTLLCEVGLEKVAIDELENIEQFYSAYILRMINDNESLSQ